MWTVFTVAVNIVLGIVIINTAIFVVYILFSLHIIIIKITKIVTKTTEMYNLAAYDYA